MENWKPITEFPMYAVSDEGRVKRLVASKYGKKAEQFMTGTLFGMYLRVTLCVNGKRYRPAIHILVAKEFVPNPLSLPEVNHKDGIKMHNAFGNLEWTTPKGNMEHAWTTGLCTPQRGEKHGRALLTENDVEQIRIQLTAGETQRSIAEKYGVARQTIGNIKSGHRWKKEN